MKKTKFISVEIISSLFMLLFLYTAISKLMDIHSFKVVLSQSPAIGNKAGFLSIFIPSLEIAITTLLFFPRTRTIGLYTSTILMAAFTGYIAYMLKYTPHLPCQCGGVLKEMSWKQHLFFNSAYVLLGIIGILISRKRIDKNSGSIEILPA